MCCRFSVKIGLREAKMADFSGGRGGGGAGRSGGVSLRVQGVMPAPSELQTAICPGKSDEEDWLCEG